MQKNSNKKINIAIGSDHAGFDLKKALLEKFSDSEYDFIDYGTYDSGSVDYPDIAFRVAEKVLSEDYKLGILVCGTGIGMSIAANKIPGIRAAACSETYSAKMARAHNNANILCIGSRVVGVGVAQDIVKTFLEIEFDDQDRHKKRIAKICSLG